MSSNSVLLAEGDGEYMAARSSWSYKLSASKVARSDFINKEFLLFFTGEEWWLFGVDEWIITAVVGSPGRFDYEMRLNCLADINDEFGKLIAGYTKADGLTDFHVHQLNSELSRALVKRPVPTMSVNGEFPRLSMAEAKAAIVNYYGFDSEKVKITVTE